jgi:hypothetical protein
VVAPDLDHAEHRPVALGHVDPPRNRDPLTDRELVGWLWRRLALRPLDEDGVVAGHLD